MLTWYNIITVQELIVSFLIHSSPQTLGLSPEPTQKLSCVKKVINSAEPICIAGIKCEVFLQMTIQIILEMMNLVS